jgi:hypothetical protein
MKQTNIKFIVVILLCIGWAAIALWLTFSMLLAF